MRIRSIKPEFWRSEDIAALDRDTRLLFIGLWSYVDDNGVGRDVEQLITADLFALDDPRESLASVHRGLAQLFWAGLIVRYVVDGKRFLSITNWSKHQKIDRPTPGRYPEPEDGVTCKKVNPRDTPSNPRDILASDSRALDAGSVEQGNRGTGDSDEQEFSTLVAVSNARDEKREDENSDDEPPPIQEESRSAPVNLSVMKIARSYCSRVRPSNPATIAPHLVNATKDWPLEAIQLAVDNLAEDRRIVTADTLRIELDNLEIPDKHGVIHYRNGATKDIRTGILRTKAGAIVGGGGPGTGKAEWRGE